MPGSDRSRKTHLHDTIIQMNFQLNTGRRRPSIQMLIVVAIPILNILASITTNFFEKGILSPGGIRAVILLVIIAFLFTKKIDGSPVTRMAIAFAAYLLILVFLSSDIIFSLNLYVKLFISLMMFPLAYQYINTYRQLQQLNYSFLIVLLIILANLLVSNIFKIGSSDYLAESIYFGSSRVNITKSITPVIFILTLLSFQEESKRIRRLILIIGIISFIIVMVGMKRTAIIALAGGFLIYYFLSPGRSRNLRYLIVIAALLLAAYPLYFDTLKDRFRAREENIMILQEDNYADEARFNEVHLVIEKFRTEGLKHQLIGSELFNDRYFYQVRRMLHMDYSIFLSGSGLIGLAMFLLLYYILYRENRRYRKLNAQFDFFKLLDAIFIVFLFSSLIMSVASTVYDINLRTIYFFYFGAMLKLRRNFIQYALQQPETDKTKIFKNWTRL